MDTHTLLVEKGGIKEEEETGPTGPRNVLFLMLTAIYTDFYFIICIYYIIFCTYTHDVCSFMYMVYIMISFMKSLQGSNL